MQYTKYYKTSYSIFSKSLLISLHIAWALTLLNPGSLKAQCDFLVSEPTPCAGMDIQFSTISSDTTFYWDFNNDGNYDAVGNEVTYSFPISTTDENYVITIALDSVACNTDTLLVLGVPDASIGVIPGTGTQDGHEIRVCSGAAQATLSIFNTSSTYDTNHSYTIDWGDGAVENYDNSTFPDTDFITHDYNGFGYYDLLVTVTGANGCTYTESYIFYNGSNPSVGLANPGNTVGLCIPATITFPITNTENNPTGTVYSIYVSGEEVATYTQDDIPDSFTYTFTESSCGISTSTGNYQNAFDVQIEAINPCASSQATIEPIELSAPPVPSLEISEPNPCIESSTFISNTSETFEVQNGNCSTNLSASWSISPGTNGVEWDLLDGNLLSSNELEIEFLLTGDYIITMTINSEDCGEVSISDTITVVTEPAADASFILVDIDGNTNNDGCLPTIANFSNLSTGSDLSWYWYIDPNDGYEFLDSTTFNDEEVIVQFNEADEYEIILFATNACETVTWDTTIVIADTPEIYLDEVPDFCEEATLNFSGSDVYYDDNESEITEYLWSFPGGDPSTSSEKRPTGIFYGTPGEYIITVEATNNCGTTILTDTFNVLQPGALDLNPDTTVCVDASGFLLFANPDGGIWSGPGVSEDGWFDPQLANIGANELEYSYSFANCPANGNIVVIVEDLPEVDAGSNQSVCVNDAPFFISGGTPENGAWESNNDGVIISNSVFDPEASGPGIYTLTYSYTDFNGCENQDSKIIIVNELPEVEAGPDRAICDNPYDIQLTGNYPPGGTWSGVGVNPDGTFNVSDTPGLGSYELIYQYEDPNTGCTNSDFIIIDVIENPVADAGSDQSVCINAGTIELIDGTPAGGSWSGPGVNSAANIFDPMIAGLGLHTLTYTFGEGVCQTIDEKIIYVEHLPVVTVPEGNDLCENAALFDLSDASPIGGTWFGIGIEGSFFNPLTAGVGSHTLTYQYINPMTGCSDEKSLDMIVHPIPQLIVADTAYCNTPGTVELPITDPPNGSWSGPGVINGQFDPQLAGGEGLYFLEYTYDDAFGCTNTTFAEVLVLPPPTIEAGPNDTLCIDQGLHQLDQFFPYGAVWSGPGIIDSINGIFDPTVAGGGIHTLIFQLGIGNCRVEDTRLIEVIDLTDAALSDPITMCESDASILINANTPSGGFWSGPGIIDPTGIFDPSVSGSGLHTVTYTYTNTAIGCNAFIIKEVTVYDIPQAIMELPDLGCLDETVQFGNNTSGDVDIVWDFGDGNSSIDFEPIHIYENQGQYNITLIAQNQFNCTDTSTQTLFITTTPNSAYDLDTETGCAPLPLNFSNQSSGFDVSFTWDFGNGITSDEPNPGTIIFDQGINDTTYYITLTAENACGSSSYMDSVLVHPIPIADFGISPESNCTPVIANFANVSTGSPTSFYWTFGYGYTSSDSLPPPQTYYTDTTTIYYPVTLTVTNQCGSNTTSQEVEVDPADVQSFFSASATTGCEPLTVDFSDFSTPGANIDWIFGDGNSSADFDPSHTFDTAGTYTVIQYASSTCGYDSTTLVIEVYPTPQVSFDLPLTACVNEPVSFENLSLGTTGHHWDFGDGDTSTLNNPIHIFETPGIYTVTLVGLSAFNQCPNSYTAEITILDAPIASFELSDLSGCVPVTIQLNNTSLGGEYYEWDFGDGNSSVLENPSHTYFEAGAYPIQLVVTDQNGCFEDTISSNVIVHPNPVIAFEYNRENDCGLPAIFNFENNSLDATGYLWDFGDGNQSFLSHPDHSYFQDGEFQVQLTASTAFGCTDSLAVEVSIQPQPIADFDIDVIQGCTPLQVFFNNESSQSNGYLWDFGNGINSTDQSALHVYETPGIYDVSLIVSNDDICFDTLVFEEAVEVLQNPIADFETITNPDGSFQFNNLSIFADQYFWDFSDGTTAENMNPSHRFLTNGIKQVYLEASSQNGCVDDTLISITPDFLKALYIPNGFSPLQGIGEVRQFKPKGVGLKEFHIQVFSPYGQLLWESREIQDGQPLEYWDGTIGGVLAPQDVYVWKAAAIFEDGSAWQGMDDGNGGYKTMGSLILLR